MDSLPSYARPTDASRSRGVSKSPSPSTSKNLSPPPKKLQRPFTITTKDRNMLTIKPADPRKPCTFAGLPTEIRQMVYAHALRRQTLGLVPQSDNRRHNPGKDHILWPALLRVSRRVRLEAAYVHYTSSNLEFHIDELQFKDLKQWLRRLPALHRDFLTKNQNLDVVFHLDLWPHPYTHRIDRWENNIHKFSEDFTAWRAYRRFGNLDTISKTHKWHFVAFCYLADWFLGYGSTTHGLSWKYQLTFEDYIYSWWDCITCTLEEYLGTVNLPCVANNAILSAQQKATMKEGVLKMLNDVDNRVSEHPRSLPYPPYPGPLDYWFNRMETLKTYIGKW